MNKAMGFIFAVMLALTGCMGSDTKEETAAPSPAPTTTQVQEQVKKETMSTNPKVLLETSKGNITLELDAAGAPNSTENFVGYVKDGFYDGLVFHRVIKGFMVQGGGMNEDMQEKGDKKAPIQNEANNGLKNDKYTVAMARTMDPHSASSQFFINSNDNDFLNFRAETPQGWGYAVFGKVVDGTDVVDAIEGVKTGTRGMHQDVPVEPVTIVKASIVE